jgi:sugar (pentulose or hexulose) kinase
MTRYLLGVDAGSSLTKAAIFDRDGRQIAVGHCRTDLLRPHPGWCEMDPDAALAAMRRAIGAALAEAGLTGDDIAAIGISAAMVGAWLVDEEGRALRPGINWEDSRAQAMLDARVAEDEAFYRRIFAIDGCVMQQGCTLPLMAWLKEHEGETLRRAAHVLSYKDYLRMRLTGRAAADRTEAAVAPGDARERERSPALITLFGLADLTDKLPPVADSESFAGVVTAKGAEAFGLKAGTPVAIGAGDAPCAVVGAGMLEKDMTTVVLGTTCIVGVVSDEPVFTPPDLGLLFTLPGKAWLRAMVNVAGTTNLDWAIRTLTSERADDPGRFAAVERLIAEIPIGAEGLVYLPYLSESGIIAPTVDAKARAGFHGLIARHGRAHMIRAVYEGVALAVRDLLQILPAGKEISLTGGGANSRLWAQMIADAAGRPVVIPSGTEFGARGAALLAATAIGWFPDIRAASLRTRRIERRHEPDPAKTAAWDRAFAAYAESRDKALPRRA